MSPWKSPWIQNEPLYSHDATTGKPQKPSLEKPTTSSRSPPETSRDVGNDADNGVERFCRVRDAPPNEFQKSRVVGKILFRSRQ
nr:hypothetical protein CFP56_79447 [Quercus suber]POF14394.1 hypothetical protein CFP56_78955 [Quercus suber]